MQKIVLHPGARTEMLDAAVYYDDCRAGLGIEFLDEVERVFSLIKTHPALGRAMRRA